MELLKIILKQLQAIHTENMLILTTLTDKDMDDEYIQKMDKAFNDTWGALKK